MNERIPAGGVVCRGGALIVAVVMTALASERTPTLAAPNPYYKILNLDTFHQDPLCPPWDCESRADDVNIWGQVVGTSRISSTYSVFRRGFRTAPNQAIVPTDVLILPSVTGADVTEAFGLNDSGVAVGRIRGDGDFAYLWPLSPPISSTEPGPWDK